MARFGLVPLADRAAERFDLRVGLFERVLRHDRADGELAVALLGDLHALRRCASFAWRKSNLSITLPGSRFVSPGRLDAHLAQHLGDDDLDVLVVDLDALAAIDVLDFADQVLLHGLFAGDAQDVVRHQRTIDERVAGTHEVARVDAQVLVVRDEVLAFDAALAADDDRCACRASSRRAARPCRRSRR